MPTFWGNKQVNFKVKNRKKRINEIKQPDLLINEQLIAFLGLSHNYFDISIPFQE